MDIYYVIVCAYGLEPSILYGYSLQHGAPMPFYGPPGELQRSMGSGYTYTKLTIEEAVYYGWLHS